MVRIFRWRGALIGVRDLRVGPFETFLGLLKGNFLYLNLRLNHSRGRNWGLILVVNIFPAYKLVLHRLVPFCSLDIGDYRLVPTTTWHRLVGELGILIKEILRGVYNFGISIRYFVLQRLLAHKTQRRHLECVVAYELSRQDLSAVDDWLENALSEVRN